MADRIHYFHLNKMMTEEDVNMEPILIDPDCDVVGIENVVEAVVDAFVDVAEGEGVELLVHH